MNVEQELRNYLLVIWRYKWMILICTFITFIVAGLLSLIITPQFKATAIVRVLSTPGGASDYTYIGSLTRLTNTYVEIASNDLTLDEVATRLELQKRPKVEIDVIPETELINISATNPDPVVARDIANTLADILVEQSLKLYGGDVPTAREILEGQLQQAKTDLESAVSEYENALKNTQNTSKNQNSNATALPNPDLETLSHIVYVRQQIYGDLLQSYETARTNEQLRNNAITLIQPATTPEKQNSPKIVLNMLLGLMAGFFFGLILAFIAEGMDDTIHTMNDVQEITELPILGVIPDLSVFFKPEHRLMVSKEGKLTTNPSFDQLRTRIIKNSANQKQFMKYLITSPEPGSGKSTVAANLAISFTKLGKRVVLVDMDLRRATQHSIFGFKHGIGVSEYLLGENTIEDILTQTSLPELRVITAGAIMDDPLVWFTPDTLKKLFDQLSKECDCLIVDSPALLSVADAMVIAPQVDNLLLVVTRYKTGRRNLKFTLQQLESLNSKIIGVVLNRMEKSSLYKYYTPEKKQLSINKISAFIAKFRSHHHTN